MNIKYKHLFAVMMASFSLNALSANDTTVLSTSTSTSTTSSNVPLPASNDNPSNKIVNQYSDWAGSTANAQSLVTGLRNGSPINLQASTTTSGASTTGITFTAPTQNMGWGNVSKALSLAQADLAAAGITNPTPEQLQTALTGGDITTIQGTTSQTTHMDGILTMRSQGMGWGQIAHKLDLHPGTAFKGGVEGTQNQNSKDNHSHVAKESETKEPVSHEQSHIQSANGSVAGKSSHITTASGNQVKNSQASTHQSSHITHAQTSRVVTASGAHLSSGSSSYIGSNHVTTQSVSHISTAASGSAMAGNNGNGLGKSLGHNKN